MNGWAWLQALLFAAVTTYGIFLFMQVVSARIRYIRLGRKENLGPAGPRIRKAIGQMLSHSRLLKDWKSGIMHLVLFYGFIIVQFGALELIIQGFAPSWHWPIGRVYPVYAVLQEITVLLILLACLYAFYRRYVEKLARLKRSWKAGVVLLFIGALMLSVLLAQAFRLLMPGVVANAGEVVQTVAELFLKLLTAGGMQQQAAVVAFYTAWWAHLLILLSFMVYVPQSKHAHLLFAPVNLAMRASRAAAPLRPVDIYDENAEQFGAGAIEQFTQDQLIDLYACVECGRCTNVCPASATGKKLSPMDVIVKLRDHLTLKGAAVTSRSPWVPAFAFGSTAGSRYAAEARQLRTTHEAWEASEAGYTAAMIGDIVSEQELWACTTCRNCEEQCPVGNEHVSLIVDMRRYLVMTEGNIAPEANRALTNIERQGNPWGINRRERGKWRESLDNMSHVPLCSDGVSFDYLLFVGSMGSYDKRSIKITQAVVKLLRKAGISFAVLGGEEGNSGDTPRRLGNDYLYQQLAEENIAAFRKYKVKRIVTIDPHAYNVMKNEYRRHGLGMEVEVVHHTELLAKLLQEGRLVPMHSVRETVVYHDSCYLGRYNGAYNAPRDILLAIPGVKLTEMAKSRENSMCCGGGGGLMWLEESEGKRVNMERTEQALATAPTVIGTACPYCLTMLSDGTKQSGVDDHIKTMDVAELLALSLDD